ncbi:DNA-directed RNA polymerase subunit omega [Ornithinibacillus halotolerans]|uniref:DNA-directed RNA polymerase subunit omega n=1 Tax=Ornithinibacillus halotolerans TaxID=1274357 RepID=A0A916S4R7_9BACI|nr:DNA-directed RNA polymerase subunit omega [Ornithinibacillus halotolerans]GGA84169.1 DNA-directed RNA polymerase subunit omega [Ornithinibacillus halotolerans]
MMLEPSVDELQEKIKSKYSLVTLSAKRARQLRELNNLRIENPKSHKYVGMALEEIAADELKLEQD